MRRVSKARIERTIVHRSIRVNVSELRHDELGFMIEAIDQAIEMTPGLEKYLPKIEYKRSVRLDVDDSAMGRYLRYMGSGGRYSYRRNKEGYERIALSAGECIDDAIGVFCHELCHVQDRVLNGGHPQIKGEAKHTRAFFTRAADLYTRVGCAEAGGFHDMVAYKSSRPAILSALPEHAAWHRRLLVLRDCQQWDQLADEFERVFGPLGE